MSTPLLLLLVFSLARPDSAAAPHGGTVHAASREAVPVTLLFGGDCLLAAHYQDAVGDDAGFAFRGFDLLRSADVSMLNLECPITERGARIPKPFNFRMRPSFTPVLAKAGVTLVNIANNHIFDYGPQGLFDTISYLDSAHVLHVGAGRDAREAYRPVVINVRGIRIGFLGFYGGGEAPGATDRSPGVARREIGRIVDAVRALRNRDSAAVVIVSLHWGTEKAVMPDEGQQAFAHQVIDAGADAVIGHHPHVLQGIERYKSGVIVYSLGNFLFGGNSRSSYSTGLFEMTISGASRMYRFIPVGVSGWRLSRLAGADSADVMERVKERSSQFRQTIFTKEGDL